jgi:hypothetical protein
VIKLNPNTTSSLHDMRVCYDPSIGGNYDARPGGHATRQHIRVSMLAVGIGPVTYVKICRTPGLTRFDSNCKDALSPLRGSRVLSKTERVI